MPTKTFQEELEEHYRKQKESAKGDAIVVALCVAMIGLFWTWQGTTHGFSFNDILGLIATSVIMTIVSGIFFWWMGQ